MNRANIVMAVVVGIAACGLPTATAKAAPPTTQPTAAAEADVRASVLAAYDAIALAMREDNAPTLGAWLADDFMLIDHQAKTNTKADLLDAIAGGIINFHAVSTAGPSVKVLSETSASLQGAVRLDFTYGKARPVGYDAWFAVTCVFAKRESQWQLVAAQMTVKVSDAKPRE